MEQEYIRYRQASMKGKIQISRRFCKFYFNAYQPLTELEQRDWEKSRYLYKACTSVGALALGFLSFRLRRASLGSLEQAGVTRDNHLPLYMLNDLAAAAIGFCLG